MKIMIRENEDDPWVEQEIVYRDEEFIEIYEQEEENLY